MIKSVTAPKESDAVREFWYRNLALALLTVRDGCRDENISDLLLMWGRYGTLARCPPGIWGNVKRIGNPEMRGTLHKYGRH